MSRARLFTLVLALLPAAALADPHLALVDELHAPLLASLDPPLQAPPATVSAPAPLDTRMPSLERVAFEAAGGIGGGLAFGFAGGIGGLLVACPSGLNHAPSCLRGLAYGSLIGVALSAAPGVFLTGHYLRGGGSFIPTFVGGLIGTGAVILLAPLMPALLPLLVFGLPVITSVAGYELSASLHASSAPITAGPAPVDRGGGWIFSTSF
jgi:hypothetical protein